MNQVLRKLCTAVTLSVGFALAAALVASTAHASVVIAGTRVVFPAQEREVTVKLTNNGKTPALVQVWLDKGDANSSPDKVEVPFTLTPPLFRLDPNKGQTLRLIYTKEPQAKDRETLFWLNVLEVPPKAAGDTQTNSLQLAFRSRIKVLFRPQGLPGRADEAPAKVTWEVVPDAKGKGYALKATNPTAYFVNLGQVSLKTGGRSLDAGAGFVPPLGSQLFAVKDLGAQPGAQAEVDYTSINDFGGGVDGKQPLQSSGAQPEK
ncbi:putative fimbrial chaperone YadV [Paraburkholderia nemoris]|uniref:fimbrial biogenesis chaperone n=1 Tax=Paraburkholderia nemoris TaxID=2793076 RepID=UPI00190B9834|nr:MULTISPECIES: fimbria/pilus periplasmic chaperone [Paraburkholderia]MBK3787216.1 fimbria/pilus periplasmic chaperone [Paraburkholderia aspalathi]CAE6868889.1 putative fimbrial chaperone YadV [Paraburkholderia nemoris]